MQNCEHEFYFNQGMGQPECKKCGLLKSTIESIEGNFEVKNAQVQKALRELGQDLKEKMPEGMGFTLLMFDYGENGAMFYLSSAQREDMIKAMKEFIIKNEK